MKNLNQAVEGLGLETANIVELTQDEQQETIGGFFGFGPWGWGFRVYPNTYLYGNVDVAPKDWA